MQIAIRVPAARVKRLVVPLRQVPVLPLAILLLLVLTALLAPVLAPGSPTEQNLGKRLLPPAWVGGGSWDYPLGTDLFGRDILSRVIYGARISLMISMTAIGVGGLFGILVALPAGYLGGRVDMLLMRAVDVALSIPTILIGIVLAVTLGPSYEAVISVIVLFVWPRYARQVRGETLAIKQRDFIALAKIAGSSRARILIVHIFPNLVPTLLVLSSLQVGAAIIMEATLSFLGVGIPPPAPAWGVMVADGKDLVVSAWWVSLFPGIAILLTVLSLNLLGDWLRDRLDPKLRQV
ncbi:MAG: ABC transporter permease [Deltaproteobacteria bacterium]|nr:ABC transporter permease [Deltaproteobacteria bacterium]